MSEIPLNHYDMLGVAMNASVDDIRAAYVRLVKIYHPDRAPPAHKQAAMKMFQAITAAYATLHKPHLRGAYDRELMTGFTPQPMNDNSDHQSTGGFWQGLGKIFL